MIGTHVLPRPISSARIHECLLKWLYVSQLKPSICTGQSIRYYRYHPTRSKSHLERHKSLRTVSKLVVAIFRSFEFAALTPPLIHSGCSWGGWGIFASLLSLF
jgi:hypothetical protein